MPIHFRKALILRKKLISAITLVAVNYYLFETLFHGLWDLYLQKDYANLKNNMRLWISHEFLDFGTIFLVLLIMHISGIS